MSPRRWFRTGIAATLLLLAYHLLVGPLALVHRLIASSPLDLRRRRREGSLWHVRETGDETLAAAARPYLSWRR